MIYYNSTRKRWIVEIDRYVDGQRIRKQKTLPAGTTESQARSVADTMEADAFTRAVSVVGADGWVAYVDALQANRKSWFYRAMSKARTRSKASGHQCSLSASMLRYIMLRSKGRCEVTGLLFQTNNPNKTRTKPYFHSLDRIDSSKGYIDGNVRLVCFAVNIAMLNWGEDVFSELATGYVFNKYAATNVTAQLRDAKKFPDRN